MVTTNDGPAVHVWDLRAIRRHLVKMDLDWDGLTFSEVDPADPSARPFPSVRVDLGPLPITESLDPGFYEPVLLDLEAGWRVIPTSTAFAGRWSGTATISHGTWQTRPNRDATRSGANPGPTGRGPEPESGVLSQYAGSCTVRPGRNAEAVATLEHSLAVNRGELAAFDLFLAMAHHRLGHGVAARGCFDRAARWLSEQTNLSDQHANELAVFPRRPRPSWTAPH